MTISFDRVANIYDDTRALSPEVLTQVVEAMLRLSHAAPDTTFIEPGIGTGRIALPILEGGYTYTGVDVSDSMMDKLRQKVEGKAYPLTLVCDDATALTFADNSFDVAIASHILHLIEDWRTAVDEMLRVLKPGGTLLYIHHPAVRISSDERLEQQWDLILAQYDYVMGWRGGTTDEVLPYLGDRTDRLVTETVAEVVKSQTVGEIVASFRDRIYSPLWQIPDSIFAPAIQTYEAWTEANYSFETVIEQRYPIEITAAYQNLNLN